MGVKSMNCLINERNNKMVTDLRPYPQLTSQITHLAFSCYGFWSKYQYIHEHIEFSNVKSLIIGRITVPRGSSDNFWRGFCKAFPQLRWLSIRGDLNGLGEISFPHLEVLTINLGEYSYLEPTYHMPFVKHLSVFGRHLPIQLLTQYLFGQSLLSLLFAGSRISYSIESGFWTRFSSLQTLGISPDLERALVEPPPGHPLRHLCLYLRLNKNERLRRVSDILVKFPSIRKLSIKIPDATEEEMEILMQIAKRLNLDLYLLGFL
jgi:hypothetical protein